MPLYNAPTSGTLTGVDDQSSSNDDQLTIKDAEIVINEDSDDVDFRVESNGNANMLIVDASTDRVGIGTATPSTSLEIQDGLTTTGAVLTLSTKEPSVVASDVLGQINFQAPLDTGADSDLVGASIQALAVTTFSDTVNATALLFKTATSETATERMRITNTGRVGIGTTSPASTLEVQGGTGTLGAVLTLSTQETSVVANDVLGQIDFQAPLDTGADSDLVGASIQALATATFSDTVNATDLILKTGASETATEKMRITSDGKVGIGTTAPANPLHVVGSALFGAITGSQGTAPRTLNLIGNDAVIRVARTSTDSPALEFLHLSADGNTRHSYWDIYTDGDRFTIRDRQSGDINVLTILETNQNVGIGTIAPANVFQVSHTGADADNGIMIVREDTSTSDGDLLGGIGFDSTDGNVPSSVLEASAFIASIATEDHGTGDKGGNLKLGVSLIDENDDTVSTIVANVGQPDTTANATTHPGLNSRATTAIVAAATYAPTIEDTGTLVIFGNASSNLTLPSINNTTTVGVQFTVFNNTGSAINAQIAVSNSATINGAAASGNDDIASFKAATFIATGNNTWARIG